MATGMAAKRRGTMMEKAAPMKAMVPLYLRWFRPKDWQALF